MAQHDIVIIDGPPVLAVTDAALLSLQVDGILRKGGWYNYLTFSCSIGECKIWKL